MGLGSAPGGPTLRGVTDETLPFGARFFLAFAAFFAVLFDGAFAARVEKLRRGAPELPPAPEPEPEPEPPAHEERDLEPALQLLSLLQREGRLVDFLQQDIADFSDADIGAAARVVHDGCARALGAHAKIEPLRSESEGARLTLEAGFDAAALKLTGNVAGKPPFSGVLRHRGWRAASIELPELVGDYDASVLAPAEVEL